MILTITVAYLHQYDLYLIILIYRYYLSKLAFVNLLICDYNQLLILKHAAKALILLLRIKKLC